MSAWVLFHLSAAVALKGFESFLVVVFHEVLMKDADESLFLLGERVEGEVGRDSLTRIDRGEFGGRADF